MMYVSSFYWFVGYYAAGGVRGFLAECAPGAFFVFYSGVGVQVAVVCQFGAGDGADFFTAGAGAGGFSAAAVGGCVLWYWGDFLWAGGEVPGGVRGRTGSGA